MIDERGCERCGTKVNTGGSVTLDENGRVVKASGPIAKKLTDEKKKPINTKPVNVKE